MTYINTVLFEELLATAGGIYAAKLKWGVGDKTIAKMRKGIKPRSPATLDRVARGAKIQVRQLVVDDDLPVAAQRANVFQLFKKGA